MPEFIRFVLLCALCLVCLPFVIAGQLAEEVALWCEKEFRR